MDAAQRTRVEKKQELLIELAELIIEEQVEEGVFLETPHYSIIELAAANLGRELSREAQSGPPGRLSPSANRKRIAQRATCRAMAVAFERASLVAAAAFIFQARTAGGKPRTLRLRECMPTTNLQATTLTSQTALAANSSDEPRIQTIAA